MKEAIHELRGITLARIADIKTQANTREWLVYLAAKMYIAEGIYVVPLRRNSKFLPEKTYSVNYGSASRKSSVIDRWFHPEEGKFAGWNIGIACGREGGVFAVDVDRHGEIDGFVALDQLLKEFKWSFEDVPSQTTPGGGMHFIFKWQENAIGSTNKIAPGIDTRGGDIDSCKGHIVVWPSQIDDKKYEWSHGGAIDEIPPWIMEKMGVAWRPMQKFGSGRGNENVSNSDLEKQVPIAQIKTMLQSIDPNEVSYDEWVRIGQSINSQHPDDDGLAVWDEWSQRGNRYKKNECSIRWSGFDPTGPIRMGTLFFQSKEAGWEPQPTDVQNNDKFSELIERINKTYAIVLAGGKIRVLREKESVDPMLGHYDLMDVNSFKTLMENDSVFIEDSKGNSKPISVARIWLGHEGRREYPNGIILDPGGNPNGYYNTWNGFTVEPRQGECSLFLKHIKGVVCNGDNDHYNWLLDWCADTVQDPSNPKGTAIVMRGKEGAGKGTLADTIGRFFGVHYRHLIDDAHLLSNFNAHMIDALFVFADEITWGGNKKTSGKLKGMVTEEYLIGERKGIDAVSYRSMIRMMISSNNDWIIPAGTNSRRWFVLDVVDSKTRDRGYFDNIKYELNNGGMEALLYFLLNRTITSDLRKAPDTHALKEQQIRSLTNDAMMQWIMSSAGTGVMDAPNIRFDDGNSNWPTQVKKSDLYESHFQWCTRRNIEPLAEMLFYMKVKGFGFTQSRIKMKKERIYCYNIPSVEKLVEFLKSEYGINIEE